MRNRSVFAFLLYLALSFTGISSAVAAIMVTTTEDLPVVTTGEKTQVQCSWKGANVPNSDPLITSNEYTGEPAEPIKTYATLQAGEQDGYICCGVDPADMSGPGGISDVGYPHYESGGQCSLRKAVASSSIRTTLESATDYKLTEEYAICDNDPRRIAGSYRLITAGSNTISPITDTGLQGYKENIPPMTDCLADGLAQNIFLEDKEYLLTDGEIEITSYVKLQGEASDDGTPLSKITGNSSDRLFKVIGTNLTLQNVVLSKGDVTSKAAGDQNGGLVLLEAGADDGAHLSGQAVVFSEGKALSGGLIYLSADTSVDLDNAYLGNNGLTGAGGVASGRGGAIFAATDANKLKLSRFSLEGNQSGSGGGAIYANATSLVELTLNKGSIVDNSSLTSGVGGVYIDGRSKTYADPIKLIVNIENVTFSGNSSNNGVGALQVEYIDLGDHLNNLTVIDNTGSGDVGGIKVGAGNTDLVLANSVIIENTNGNCDLSSVTQIIGHHNLVPATDCLFDTGDVSWVNNPSLSGEFSVLTDFDMGSVVTKGYKPVYDGVAVDGGSKSAGTVPCAQDGLDQRLYVRDTNNCDIGAIEFQWARGVDDYYYVVTDITAAANNPLVLDVAENDFMEGKQMAQVMGGLNSCVDYTDPLNSNYQNPCIEIIGSPKGTVIQVYDIGLGREVLHYVAPAGFHGEDRFSYQYHVKDRESVDDGSPVAASVTIKGEPLSGIEEYVGGMGVVSMCLLLCLGVLRKFRSILRLALTAILLVAGANTIAAEIKVTTESSAVDNTDGVCSLPEAVMSTRDNGVNYDPNACAHGDHGGRDVIVFASELFDGKYDEYKDVEDADYNSISINLDSGISPHVLRVFNTLTIKGPTLANKLVKTEIKTDRAHLIKSTAPLTLENITLSGGSTSGAGNAYGGLIEIIDASLTLDKAQLLNGQAGSGGAVYISGEGIDLVIIDSHFENNTCGGSWFTCDGGGAIAAVGFGTKQMEVTIERSSFFGNNSDFGGSALDISGNVKLEISSSTFAKNGTASLTTPGAAIDVTGVSKPYIQVTLNNNTIVDNISSAGPAGIAFSCGTALEGVSDIGDCHHPVTNTASQKRGINVYNSLISNNLNGGENNCTDISFNNTQYNAYGQSNDSGGCNIYPAVGNLLFNVTIPAGQYSVGDFFIFTDAGVRTESPSGTVAVGDWLIATQTGNETTAAFILSYGDVVLSNNTIDVLDPIENTDLADYSYTHYFNPVATERLVNGASPNVANGASAACVLEDQLGRNRNTSGRCDIGAVERFKPSAIPDELKVNRALQYGRVVYQSILNNDVINERANQFIDLDQIGLYTVGSTGVGASSVTFDVWNDETEENVNFTAEIKGACEVMAELEVTPKAFGGLGMVYPGVCLDKLQNDHTLMINNGNQLLSFEGGEGEEIFEAFAVGAWVKVTYSSSAAIDMLQLTNKGDSRDLTVADKQAFFQSGLQGAYKFMEFSSAIGTQAGAASITKIEEQILVVRPTLCTKFLQEDNTEKADIEYDFYGSGSQLQGVPTGDDGSSSKALVQNLVMNLRPITQNDSYQISGHSDNVHKINVLKNDIDVDSASEQDIQDNPALYSSSCIVGGNYDNKDEREAAQKAGLDKNTLRVRLGAVDEGQLIKQDFYGSRVVAHTDVNGGLVNAVQNKATHGNYLFQDRTVPVPAVVIAAVLPEVTTLDEKEVFKIFESMPRRAASAQSLGYNSLTYKKSLSDNQADLVPYVKDKMMGHSLVNDTTNSENTECAVTPCGYLRYRSFDGHEIVIFKKFDITYAEVVMEMQDLGFSPLQTKHVGILVDRSSGVITYNPRSIDYEFDDKYKYQIDDIDGEASLLTTVSIIADEENSAALGGLSGYALALIMAMLLNQRHCRRSLKSRG